MTLPSIGLGPTTSEYSEQLDLAPWPAPRSPSIRVPTSEIMAIRSVASLAVLAKAHGWKTTITHAVGCWPTIGARPSRQRASYAVRMWRGAQRAVAVYVEPPTAGGTWSWDTLLEWDIESFPRGHATIGAFTDTVFGPERKPAWPGPKDWTCPYFGPIHGPDKPKRVRS